MKRTYTIQIESGSEFQDKVIREMVDSFFKALHMQIIQQHRHNDLKISQHFKA